jgi:hypothetical protein
LRDGKLNRVGAENPKIIGILWECKGHEMEKGEKSEKEGKEKRKS